MTDSGPPLTPKHIEKLETRLGARLPAAYRRFLLKHNGGRPNPHHFRNDAMDRFLGILPKDEDYDIWDTRKTLKEWLPAEVLPIAVNAFGDFICLAIKGKNRGKVYFWDHEGGSPTEDPWLAFRDLIYSDKPDMKPKSSKRPLDWPGHPDLTLIADSFDELLDSFHDEDEAPAPGKRAKKKRKK